MKTLRAGDFENVSRETESFTSKVKQQVADKIAGFRKKVFHGGALCSGCYQEPPLAGQRYGRNCHNKAVQASRDKKKAINARNAAIADGVLSVVEQAANTTTSKGKDHGQPSPG